MANGHQRDGGPGLGGGGDGSEEGEERGRSDPKPARLGPPVGEAQAAANREDDPVS
jgi:hypothetical protein